MRHPPRGVPKNQHAAQNWYDVWLPDLAPTAPTVKLALAAVTDRQWAAFVKKYRAEVVAPEKVLLLELLAALSRQSSISVGCYCADELHCHQAVLRQLLEEHDAHVV